MGIALSALRCCLCLDDDEDPPPRPAYHQVSSYTYSRIANSPSAASAPSTTFSRLLSTPQPAVAASARTYHWHETSIEYTTRAADTAPRPVGSATSTTRPTQSLSTLPIQQAHVESPRPGSCSVTGPAAAGRAAAADSCEVRRAVLAVTREVNRALPGAARTVVSSTPSCTPSPRPAVSSNTTCTLLPPPAVSPYQSPRVSEATQRSAQVQGSSLGQNPAPPATSTPWRTQAAVAGGSTSASLETRPVRWEVSMAFSSAARSVVSSTPSCTPSPRSSFFLAPTCTPSPRSAISSTPTCTLSPPPAVAPNQPPRVSEATQRSAQVQCSSLGQNPAPSATTTPWRTQAAVAGGSTSASVETRTVKREVNRALPAAARSVVSSTPSCTPSPRPSVSSTPTCTLSPPPAVSPNQPPRVSEATQRSAQVQGSSLGQNPAPPATSTPWRTQAAVAGGSTSASVETRPVKREVTRDVSRAARTHDLYGVSENGMQKAASTGTDTRERHTSNYRPPIQSNQNQVSVENADILKLKEIALNTRNGSPKAQIPVYEIPPSLKEMIKLDKVPSVLKEPLSASNYNEYFACLLYAEDFYLEKWSDYLLRGVTLECLKRSSNYIIKKGSSYSKKSKDHVAFEIESIPEKRPYILSRDFVFLQPLESNCQRIQGRVVRVQNSTKVSVEFEDDFWLQHSPQKRYDVSFSFNRVCLKRAHQAVANALGSLLFSFLFPENVHKAVETTERTCTYSRKLRTEEMRAVNQITNLKGCPPYLIAGPPCSIYDYKSCRFSLTKTALTICEAIIQIYRAHSNCRILICTPRNVTCDQLLIELSEEISESQQFRANAAFRDYGDVPGNILPSCQFNDDDQCFTCPPLNELRAFKAVTSTYMSSFRLRRAGIKPGHFTHIFLLDACRVAEPEAVVPLANLASEDTTVVISGSLSGLPWYVRSDMARRWGLATSYFARLLRHELYNNESSFVCRLSEDSSRARSDTPSH